MNLTRPVQDLIACLILVGIICTAITTVVLSASLERGPALAIVDDPITTVLAFTVPPGFWRIGYNSHVWTAWVEADTVVWSMPPEIWSEVDAVWVVSDSAAMITVRFECEPCTTVTFEDPPRPAVSGAQEEP